MKTPIQLAVRPAAVADFPVLARLQVQLLDAMVPGALSGGTPEAREQLLQFVLEAKNQQGLIGRYVTCDALNGELIGSGAIELPGMPHYERAPDGTMPLARRLLGGRGTLKLLSAVARTLLPIPRPRNDATVAWLHSLVVDERYRGQGIGRSLVAELEQQAIAHGCTSIWLQVLVSNESAHRLYLQMGYQDVWTTPRWQRSLTWPSYLMRKELPKQKGREAS